MHYRPMGSTGVLISEIAFGTGDNAGLLVRGTLDDQRRAFERALDLGINYWDTSPDYGDHQGIAETNIGRLIKEFGVRPIITTKVEVMPEELNDIAGAVERSLDRSLQRLGVDWVDVLQIHNPPHLERNAKISGWIYLGIEDYLGPGGALEGLERVQRQGKVRFLGFASEHAEAEAVRRLLDTGFFRMINVWFDLLNPTAGYGSVPGMCVGHDYERIIDHAARAGAGVAIMRPLAGGSLAEHAIAGGSRHPLAGGGLSRNRETYQEMVEQASSMAFLSKPGEHKLSDAAYRFILAKEGVTTVIGGYSEIDHLEQAVANSGAAPLSPEEMARLEMVWRANYGRFGGHTWASA